MNQSIFPVFRIGKFKLELSALSALAAGVLMLSASPAEARGFDFGFGAGGGTGGGSGLCAVAQCYEFGDTGFAVAQIQSALGIVADGIYGPQTERAVRNFQASVGLSPDGVAGPRTLASLGLDGLGTGGGNIPFPDNNVFSAPYVVAVPGGNFELLRQVRRYAPQAIIRNSSRGEFIQANSYVERSFAEGFAGYLRGQGFDARVTYLP
jgi:peptidoglycan hydrolase-like protein with peptidoglycan-binding domain